MGKVTVTSKNGEKITFEASDLSRPLDEIYPARAKVSTAKAEKLRRKLLEELEKIQNQTESASESNDVNAEVNTARVKRLAQEYLEELKKLVSN